MTVDSRVLVKQDMTVDSRVLVKQHMTVDSRGFSQARYRYKKNVNGMQNTLSSYYYEH